MSLATRAAHGGAALARPFDGTNIDLLTGPGPRATVTALSNTYTGSTLSMGTGAPSNGGNLGLALSDTAINYNGATPYGVELYGGAVMTDCYSQLPVASGGGGAVVLIRCDVPTAVNAQVAFNNSQPAISVTGLVKYCTVNNTAEDGIWPAGQLIVEDFYAMGGQVPFFGGWTVAPAVIPWESGYTVGENTGLPMTKAQILSAVNYYNENGSGQNGGTNGVTVPWGGFLIAPSTGSVICPMYQCVGSVDGTTNPPLIGNESTSTWPSGSAATWRTVTGTSNSTPAQPFTTGNALFAYIGGAYHCDTIQCVGNPSGVTIRNFKVGQFANTVCLLQNDATAKSLPPMNWTFEHGRCYGAGSTDIPINTLTSAGPTGTGEYTVPSGSNANIHNPQGPFLRNSNGTWEVSPNAGMSMPWFVTCRDITHMNSISSFEAARNPASDVYFDKAYDTGGMPVLPSLPARDLLIASQYGWDVTDQRVAMMRDYQYNWATLGQPAPVSSVLEARFQALSTAVPTSSSKAQLLSAVPAACAAQCMPVIAPSCRNQQGVSITPSTNAAINYPVSLAGVTDANGYCLLT